jgi:hypothetical protein
MIRDNEFRSMIPRRSLVMAGKNIESVSLVHCIDSADKVMIHMKSSVPCPVEDPITTLSTGRDEK